MELSDKQYKKVINLLRKKVLRESPKYQQMKAILLCGTLVSGFLAFMSYFFAGDIIAMVANFVIGPAICFTVADGILVGICRWAANASAEQWAKPIISLFSDYDELIDDLQGKTKKKGSDTVEQEVQYDKYGRAFIDVDFVDVPADEASDVVYEAIPNPGIIDVEWYPIEEVSFADNIKFLMEYVEDVKYEGYEADLGILETMLDFLSNGEIDELTKSSMENSLHVLADAILNKACKKYGLPLVRKIN